MRYTMRRIEKISVNVSREPKEMWKPTNLMEALLPIFIIDWIFCHGVMHYKSVKTLKHIHSFLYSIFTTVLYVCVLIFFILNFLSHKWDNLITSTNTIVRLTLIIMMLINITIGWILRKKAVELNTEIIRSDETLKSIGITIDSRSEFFYALKIAVLWIIFVVFTSTIAAFRNFQHLELFPRTVTVLVVFHGFYVHSLHNLRFFLLIKHMRLRYKSLNRKLKDFFSIHTKIFGSKKTNKNGTCKWVTVSPASSSISSTATKLKLDSLHNIRRTHLELEILCSNITKIYGTSIVLTTIGIFMFLTVLMYRQCEGLLRPDTTIYIKLMNIGLVLSWSLPLSFCYFSIHHTCEMTINEWNQTGKILDRLLVESEDTELQIEVHEFLSQIQRNPLKFSPCGFFELNHNFIRDFWVSIVGYLVVIKCFNHIHHN